VYCYRSTDGKLRLANVSHSQGHSVLCSFLLLLQDGGIQSPSANAAVIRPDLSLTDVEIASRLFLAYCDPEVGVPCSHRNDLGHEVDTTIIPLTNVAMSIIPDHEAELRLFQPMRHILPYIYNLNERDLFGRTALLASVEGVQRSQFPKVAQMLLQFGANPSAVDNGGAGILHFILRTISGCNNWNVTAESTQPLKTLMIQLINSECDPNLLDDDGLTPSDMALSPVAWVIWCEVVQAAGLDVLSVLERDDELQGIILPHAYVEEKYRRVLRAPSPSWNDQSIQSDSPQEKEELCRYCAQPDHWSPSRPPFDRAGSYMVNMGDSVAHAYFSNHRDGSFCDNGISWGSCKKSSHARHGEVTVWPVNALSWRKHVAYRLWRDGLLRTPRQAYTWSTGLSPDW
jgi:hypothetical protein